MTPPPCWVIQHYPTLGSTMDRAAVFARGGAPEGVVVVSDEQTAGRGRAGRAWYSPPGAALYATLLLRPAVTPPALATLPLLAGVAVAEALESLTGAAVQLKWPNDVWLGSDPEHRKVAGILLTSAITNQLVTHVLCGIGINLTMPPDALPPGGASVLAATGMSLSPAQILPPLLSAFAAQYTAYLTHDGQPSLDAWRQRAALIGQDVTIADAGGLRSGRFLDIAPDGALLLEQDGGVHRVVAGDLTRGPRSA